MQLQLSENRGRILYLPREAIFFGNAAALLPRAARLAGKAGAGPWPTDPGSGVL